MITSGIARPGILGNSVLPLNYPGTIFDGSRAFDPIRLCSATAALLEYAKITEIGIITGDSQSGGRGWRYLLKCEKKLT